MRCEALSNQPSRVAENEKAHRLEMRRQEILSQRKRKKNVQNTEDNQAVGRKLYEEGLRQLRAGDSEGAAKTFKMAVTYDPSVDEYQTLRDEVSRQAETERARDWQLGPMMNSIWASRRPRRGALPRRQI